MRVLPYGRSAVLLEVDDPLRVPAVAAALRAHPDVLEVVPGARTLLVRRHPDRAGEVERLLASLPADLPAPPHDAAGPASVVLDVVYDGADLASTAALVGLDPDGLVRAHTAARYVVAFCGFVPGFAYLTGLDAAVQVPRLDTPRARVPAGSVAVAGGFTGVYPRASPGGWRLLGRTDATLWDVDREPPALLAPGTAVTFSAVR